MRTVRFMSFRKLKIDLLGMLSIGVFLMYIAVGVAH